MSSRRRLSCRYHDCPRGNSATVTVAYDKILATIPFRKQSTQITSRKIIHSHLSEG